MFYFYLFFPQTPCIFHPALENVIKRFKVFRAGIHSTVDFYPARRRRRLARIVSQGLDTTARSFRILPPPRHRQAVATCTSRVLNSFSFVSRRVHVFIYTLVYFMNKILTPVCMCVGPRGWEKFFFFLNMNGWNYPIVTLVQQSSSRPPLFRLNYVRERRSILFSATFLVRALSFFPTPHITVFIRPPLVT